MAETHKHDWKILSEHSVYQTDKKNLTLRIKQLCDCGVYRIKDFINEEDKGGDK